MLDRSKLVNHGQPPVILPLHLGFEREADGYWRLTMEGNAHPSHIGEQPMSNFAFRDVCAPESIATRGSNTGADSNPARESNIDFSDANEPLEHWDTLTSIGPQYK